jgi:hypothetical protein
MVEAALLGRRAIGTDVDPVAVYVSRVKTRPLREAELRKTFHRLLSTTAALERDAADYERFMFSDLSPEAYEEEVVGLAIPAIPNLFHWFRHYVVTDLARLRRAIRGCNAPASHRAFFELCFASIIRGASNADPVPVSGLEVTSHMKRLDEKGRLVNPFALFRRTANRAIMDMEAYAAKLEAVPSVSVLRQDATRLNLPGRTVDAVITSPPYHGAVDYYRRHQLEMFWLGLTTNQDERLALLQDYMGRPRLSTLHPFVRQHEIEQVRAAALERRIRKVDGVRADAFKHYCVAMTKVFDRLGRVLRPGRPAVLVVGHSSWNGDQLNTSKLFAELAHPHFTLNEQLWYPVRNRYMSYSRHNQASIDREYVLVMERTNAG